MKCFVLAWCLVSVSLFGLEVKCCLIADPSKHEWNQKILTEILEQELTAVSTDQARHLMVRISQIAEALLKRGFSPDAYDVPQIDENSGASFSRFPLWEGECNQGQLPITFFAYVWPPEAFALQYNANSCYGTVIHSHPIPCAFAVLEGTLVQKNYELVDPDPRLVRLIGEEAFNPLDGAVDDLQEPFIHQLRSVAAGSKPSVSLHAYGLPSAEKVMRSFRETRPLHIYDRVLQSDGAIQVIP